MSQAKTRVALLGAGYIADYHVDALRAQKQVAVVAVCDLNRGRAERLAGLCGAGVAVHTDLEQMVVALRPDVVHVLTPPPAHFGATRTLIQAGVNALVEKPLAINAGDCQALDGEAKARGVALGVSHNFLFADVYERLAADLHSGRLGRIDQIDVVWNKALPQIQLGPFGAWLFQDFRNILFEVAPHSFAHVAHLVGSPERVRAEATSAAALPGGRRFYRRWEVQAWRGPVSVRLRFSFIDGYPEHYVHVRGSGASATADFEQNTYLVREHNHDLLDFDRFATTVSGARDALLQATATVGRFLAGKAGLDAQLGAFGGPYQTSITRTVAAFYRSLGGPLDRRLSAGLAGEAVALAQSVAAVVEATGEPSRRIEASAAPPKPKGVLRGPVLVMGGTGFIGRALVRRLREEGHPVRVLARDPDGQAELFARLDVEVLRGDFTDEASVLAALEGVRHVYHLARGNGRTWDDYLRFDVEPTRRVAERCLAHGVDLLYTSSIAIYHLGRPGETVTEETPPHDPTIRVSLYARAKLENERRLLGWHRTRGLKAVVFRPAIVIGTGGTPFHGGIASFPTHAVCRLPGDGSQPLPLVLVEDCADAMVRALGAKVVGESFNLAGDVCLTAHEYLDEIERCAGIKIKRLPTPHWRSFAEAVAKWGIKAAARDPERRTPSYQELVSRGGGARLSGDKAKARLGWNPAAERETVIRKGIHVPVEELFSQVVD